MSQNYIIRRLLSSVNATLFGLIRFVQYGSGIFELSHLTDPYVPFRKTCFFQRSDFERNSHYLRYFRLCFKVGRSAMRGR